MFVGQYDRTVLSLNRSAKFILLEIQLYKGKKQNPDQLFRNRLDSIIF